MTGERHPWTVYYRGDPVGIATDADLEALFSLLRDICVKHDTWIIEIGSD